MGGLLTKCLGPSAPPTVFTICQVDGKAHDFGDKKPGEKIADADRCMKCRKSRQTIDNECQLCQDGQHAWVQDFVPVASGVLGFAIGSQVLVRELIAKPEHNGKFGTVLGGQGFDRVQIRLDDCAGTELALKPANIEAQPVPAGVAVDQPAGTVATAEKEAADLQKMIAEKREAVAAQAAPVQSAQTVMPVLKCVHCGLRQQMGPDGAYVYDDYYMYGGGYMMGLEMGLMLGVMGAADGAYADPMYGDYYGGDFGGEEGFAADGGFGFDGGDDFDFE